MPDMTNTILITGSLAFDYLMTYPEAFAEHIIPEKLKTLSLTFDVTSLHKNFGGNAGNIAYTLALLKTKTEILTSVGKEDFQNYNDHLAKYGIGTQYVKRIASEHTASAFGITDKNSAQLWAFYPGALKKNILFSLEELSFGQDYSYLVIGPQVADSIGKLTEEAIMLHIPYLYTPGQEITYLPSDQLKAGIRGADVVLVNDYELAMITKKTGWKRSDIVNQTKVFIVTLGSLGSEIETHDGVIKIGAVKPRALIDPTGAGDSYVAGFIAGFAQKQSLKQSGQMGALAATFTIEEQGTQSHTFSSDEFIKRYEATFSDTLTL